MYALQQSEIGRRYTRVLLYYSTFARSIRRTYNTYYCIVITYNEFKCYSDFRHRVKNYHLIYKYIYPGVACLMFLPRQNIL